MSILAVVPLKTRKITKNALHFRFKPSVNKKSRKGVKLENFTNDKQ